MKHHRLITALFCLAILVLLSAAIEGPAATAPTGAAQTEALLEPEFINLNMAVNFTAQDGGIVSVSPAVYKVEAADQGLRLIQRETSTTFLIQAKKATHETTLDSPLALSIPGSTEEEADIHYVGLLLPGGQSLEAAGTYSGISPRGLFDDIGKGLVQAKKTVDKATAPAGKAIDKATAPAGKALEGVGKKIATDVLKAKRDAELFAKVQSCKLTVSAIQAGKALAGLGQLLPIAKQRQAGVQNRLQIDRAFRDHVFTQVTAHLNAHTYAIPELKRIAAHMNNPRNRAVLEAIFSPDNFCQDSVSAMDQRLIRSGLIPNFAAVRTRGGEDSHFYMGYQATFGGGVGVGVQVGLLGVTDFRGNGGKYWFIGPQGVTNANVGVTAEVAFFPKVSLEDFKGWGGGAAISGGPPSKIVSAAVDLFFAESFQGVQGFGFGPGVGLGVIPGDISASYTHSWKY